MSRVSRLALVDPNDSSREEIKSLLLGLDQVWLEAECSRYDFFSDVVAQTEPDVGIICLDEDPDKGLQLIQQTTQIAPDCQVIAVSSSTDGTLILNAMRSGAKEFITAPVKPQELLAAFERINQSSGGASEGKSQGCKIIALAGSGGGVGSTSLAVNLGCALALDKENTVALIDLDVALGDADVFLDTIPDYTLSDVAQNSERMDFTLLKRSLTQHASGLHLLPRPVQLQEAEMVTGEDLSRLLGLLKASFTHVLVDLSKSYSPLDMVALKEAEHVFLVTQLDLPCLRNVVRLMMSFSEVEDLKEKTRIVVNRVGMGVGQISLKKAKETIGGEIFWQIPNDYRVMSEVRNNGVPLVQQAPKANITQSILGLAAAVNENLDVSSMADNSGLSKWLSFWPNKGKAEAAD